MEYSKIEIEVECPLPDESTDDMTCAFLPENAPFLWLRTDAAASFAREKAQHAVRFGLVLAALGFGRHGARRIAELGPATRLVQHDVRAAGPGRVA